MNMINAPMTPIEITRAGPNPRDTRLLRRSPGKNRMHDV